MSSTTIAARWEHFPHQADMGVRGIGPTKAEAFAQAALALIAVITDPGAVAAKEPVTVSCEAPDDELLLVDWLNAIVYEIATRKMLFGRFDVRIEGARHQPAVEVKGATYTALSVRQDPGGAWIAQCVVDV